MSALLKYRQVLTNLSNYKGLIIKGNIMAGNGAPMSIDIGGMRAKYKGKEDTFTESDLAHKEPIGQFKTWFDEACITPGIVEANAMCLATATKDGVPSARYVLLKGYGKTGFKFFTNYESRKGREITENPRVALTFYWDVLKRQVRVEGRVEQLGATESDDYFHSRPFVSQVSACASRQSSAISSRDVLTATEERLAREFDGDGKVVPRPDYWGGYLVVPEAIEFWQGQSDRLHDRIKFRRQAVDDKPDGVLLHGGEDGWVYERLSP